MPRLPHRQGQEAERICTKGIIDKYPEVHRALVEEQARIVQVDEELRGVLTARRTGWLLTIGWAVIQAYERLKGQRAALDFDDLIERTRRLLATPDGLDWVLYKLDQRIAHVLVDEAQDTSPAQWELVERLTQEFFAGEGAHASPPTLFVVGDEKQSIYRFQGADLANFRDVRARLEARADACGRPIRRETLDLSFRSTQPVLRLVDAVFASGDARQGVVDPDALVHHDTWRSTEPGVVELWPMAVARESEEQPRSDWPLPDEVANEDEPQRRFAVAIAGRVRDWLDAGEPLPSTGRPVRAGDVIVLLQRRGELQELLVRALKRVGVEVAGADRLALTDHIAVKDLVALGRAMLLPEDDLNLACLLKSPLIGLDEEALLDLAWDRGERQPDRATAVGGRAEARAVRRGNAADHRLAAPRRFPAAVRVLHTVARCRARPRALSRPPRPRGAGADRGLSRPGAGLRAGPSLLARRLSALARTRRAGAQARPRAGRRRLARDDGARCQGARGAGGDPGRRRAARRPDAGPIVVGRRGPASVAQPRGRAAEPRRRGLSAREAA